ncbi:MAG: cyclase family protein [Fibrella sp.]|nr:cyclase family protein [Armatimonadota bacterium]
MCAPTIIQQALAGISRRELLALTAAGVTTPALAAPPAKRSRRLLSGDTIVDMTHTLSSNFPIIPIPGLTFPFRQEPIATMEKNGVFANKWELIEHNGTHIDAPSHFAIGQPNLEAVPASTLIAPLAVIDIRAKAAKNHDAPLTPDDILAWEKRHGRLPQGVAVFMWSGWDERAKNAKDFLNMDASQTMHFPGFTPETCEFLLRERKISGIGVDTISFDLGVDKEYTAHKALFKGGKWGIECVHNLALVPPKGATIFAGALKVAGASGSPIRLLAMF